MTMTVPRVARRLARSPFRCPAVLRRQSAGSFNQYGEFEPGQVVEVAVNVVSAPIDGEERRVLPEGLRERDVRTFWTAEPLDPVQEGNSGQTGDRIVLSGVEYLIVASKAWDGGWYEAMGVAQVTP